MDTYTALLVDDEAHCLRTLEQQLSWVDLPINTVGKVKSVSEALGVLNSLEQAPTFIFLDIHMGDEDGFSLLDQIDLENSHVIFTTAFEEYALQAFKERASGYLTKPISTDDLELLLKSITSKNKITNGNQVLKINSRSGQEVLNLAEILYAEANGSYSKMYMNDGSVKVISKNLKSLTKSEISLPRLQIARLTVPWKQGVFVFYDAIFKSLNRIGYFESRTRNKGMASLTKNKEIELEKNKFFDIKQNLDRSLYRNKYV